MAQIRTHIGTQKLTKNNGRRSQIQLTRCVFLSISISHQANLVRSRRLELPRLAAQRPQRCASTNSATTAHFGRARPQGGEASGDVAKVLPNLKRLNRQLHAGLWREGGSGKKSAIPERPLRPLHRTEAARGRDPRATPGKRRSQWGAQSGPRVTPVGSAGDIGQQGAKRGNS